MIIVFLFVHLLSCNTGSLVEYTNDKGKREFVTECSFTGKRIVLNEKWIVSLEDFRYGVKKYGVLSGCKVKTTTDTYYSEFPCDQVFKTRQKE